MKTTAKNIKKGMTIQYTGYHTTENGISHVSCGSIKKTSPIVTIASVEYAPQMFSGLKGLFVKTECGLTLKFSTRQSIVIIS